jgi:ketosteroid isomerase-like protein
MFMRLFPLFLLIALASLSVSGQDEATSSAISKIMAMEKAWNQAFKLRDTNAVNALLDDNVILVDHDGSIQSKAQFLAWVRSSSPSEEEQISPESMTVHVAGDVAIATGTFRARGMRRSKAYVRQDRFVDTWIRKNGAWVCVSASAIPVLH